MSLADFISAIEEIAMAELDQNISEENVEHPLEVEEPEQKEALVNDTGAGGGEMKWPGWPGESVFRMLVPAQKVGGLIGRKGELIKKIVEETKSRIKVLDGNPGTLERVVMVSAREEPESSLPPAVDGLLRIHKFLHDGLEGDASNATSKVDANVSAKLLVPASQAGCLIGKQGGTVKSIQEATNCIVRVLGQEESPVLVLRDDRVVEVVGDLASVRNAIEMIALLLRKFLVDRSVIPMFEVKIANPHQPWNAPGYRPTQYMLSPQIDGSYMLAEVPPPMEKQSHHGISAHGKAAPANSMATQQMQVPLSSADAVIGHGGTNISYIRRASGATVTIQETRDLPAEMTVEISGTASQVQSAKQLIQDFMAEAAAAQQPMKVGPTDEEYQDHNSVYECPPSTPGNSGAYVLVYGANGY